MKLEELQLSAVSVFRRSYLLSPQYEDGHGHVGVIYGRWLEDRGLKQLSRYTEILRAPSISPPDSDIKHQSIKRADLPELIDSHWRTFMRGLADSQADIDEEFLDLVNFTASMDLKFFAKRMSGKGVKAATGSDPAPSLLRAYVFENRFPNPHDEASIFYNYLLEKMAWTVAEMLAQYMPHRPALRQVVRLWQANFEGAPFIPEDFSPKLVEE